MNDSNLNTGLSARSTDPITSHLSAMQAEGSRSENEAKVLELLASVPGGLTSYQLSEVLEIRYVTVAPLMRPLARLGKVHELGLRDNPGSGHKAIVWGLGPSPNFVPGKAMPTKQTGPQRAHKFKPFTVEEIVQWNKDCGYADIFAEFLNAQVLLRIS